MAHVYNGEIASMEKIVVETGQTVDTINVWRKSQPETLASLGVYLDVQETRETVGPLQIQSNPTVNMSGDKPVIEYTAIDMEFADAQLATYNLLEAERKKLMVDRDFNGMMIPVHNDGVRTDLKTLHDRAVADSSYTANWVPTPTVAIQMDATLIIQLAEFTEAKRQEPFDWQTTEMAKVAAATTNAELQTIIDAWTPVID